MRIFNRIKEDKGAANTISFMVIMLFIMTMLVSFIDVGLYFNTKNQMQSAAENGARSVALYGGVDTIVRDHRGGATTPEDLAWASIPSSLKKPDMKTVIVKKDGITCYPKTRNKTIKAGDEVYCEVTYIYNGIAGKFGLFNLGKGTEAANRAMTVRGTSVSEVSID